MSVYEIITEKIIKKLEEGVIPWQKGWTGAADGAYNFKTKRRYSLLNQMLLSHQGGYLTFKQIKELGGTLKKGAKSEIVVFWKIMRKEDENDLDSNGDPRVHTIPVLRYYTVFWVGDTDIREEEVAPVQHEPLTEAESVITEYLAREPELTFVNDVPSNQAYYAPLTESVVVPMMSQFENVEEYYSTAFHELTHSTGSQKRLGRIKVTELAAFGSESYSKEELVAELGAAMLVSHCGIESEKSFRNSAAYIQSWLKALKNDSRMIVSAASKAEKAVNYILTGEKGTVA